MFQLQRYTNVQFGSGCVISVVSCILYVIYFGSGGSCSYSSGGPPGGDWCAVCSHLAPAEVSFMQVTVIVCHQYTGSTKLKSMYMYSTGLHDPA